MIAVIRGYQGTVDEIRGDGLLVFFGAPIAHGQEELRAVACAIEMQNEMPALNAALSADGYPALQIGIGIHTGEVVVGNIGSEQRSKYSAVGSAINTAFRIESHTVGGQVLISERTRSTLGARLRVGRRMALDFKGARGTETVYPVKGLETETGGLRLAVDDSQRKPLNPPVALSCYAVTGKAVSNTALIGRLVAVGPTGADIQMETPPAVLSNIKIVLHGGDADRPPRECYAKVTRLKEGAPPIATVTFTSMADDLLQGLGAANPVG
jgi:adenylate cyclase